MLACSFGPSVVAGAPSFEPLLWEGLLVTPTDISADGSVIVGAGPHLDSQGGEIFYSDHAFRWDTGVFTDLGRWWTPSGVSGDGSVIAGNTDGNQAIRWESGATTALGLPTGFEDGRAAAVSADGSVIVGGATQTYNQTQWAVRWAAETPTAICEGEGYGVSADGQIVAGDYPSWRAFRWESGVLSTLDGTPAYGISADGTVIVGGGYAGSDGGEAFRWEGDAATGLGLLPGAAASAGYDASADGSVIVGSSWPAWSDGKAFIWTEADGMRDLQDVLVNDYALNLADWELTEAVAISDDGMTIVGNGIYTLMPGVSGPGGWVAHIPEPCSALLLIVGGACCRRWRRHGLADDVPEQCAN